MNENSLPENKLKRTNEIKLNGSLILTVSRMHQNLITYTIKMAPINSKRLHKTEAMTLSSQLP